MMGRDSDADEGRRAWGFDCPACQDGADCATCLARKTCDVHWRYFLGQDTSLLFLQCRKCWHRWWQNTRFGAGGRGRPDNLFALPEWPEPGEDRKSA